MPPIHVPSETDCPSRWFLGHWSSSLRSLVAVIPRAQGQQHFPRLDFDVDSLAAEGHNLHSCKGELCSWALGKKATSKPPLPGWGLPEWGKWTRGATMESGRNRLAGAQEKVKGAGGRNRFSCPTRAPVHSVTFGENGRNQPLVVVQAYVHRSSGQEHKISDCRTDCRSMPK